VKENGWVFLHIPHPVGEHTSQDKCSFDEHEHLYSFSRKEIERLMGKEKSFQLEIIHNETGSISWFVSFQV
ncbi:MAG: hypothetical protein AABY22_01105, partial [Nanoarchaeota archaeon]